MRACGTAGQAFGDTDLFHYLEASLQEFPYPPQSSPDMLYLMVKVVTIHVVYSGEVKGGIQDTNLYEAE